VARRNVAGLIAALLVVAYAPPTLAQQVNPFRVQQRYKEASQGKSIDDYTKRLNDPDPPSASKPSRISANPARPTPSSI